MKMKKLFWIAIVIIVALAFPLSLAFADGHDPVTVPAAEEAAGLDAAVDQFVDMFKVLVDQGPLGIGIGILIIVIILVFRYTGLVDSGNKARLAITLLSFGLPGGELTDSDAWVARVVTAVISTLLYTLGGSAATAIAARKNGK